MRVSSKSNPTVRPLAVKRLKPVKSGKEEQVASFAKKRLLLAPPTAIHQYSHAHTFIKYRISLLCVQHIKYASGACTDIKSDTQVS